MQKLLLSDYSKIKKYLDDANYEGYNSNFVTMMMWDHEYAIYYEIKEHFMIMLHTYLDEKFFAMPFCKPEYYQEAINYMLEYAKINKFQFRIDLAIEESSNLIKNIYGDKFLYLHNDDYDDYIYLKASLETLSGKKMQKRRNHFNAFIKENSNFIYKEIEDEDVDNVLQCLKKWDFSHRIEESVVSEYIGIVYLLVHREELKIKTGCIYIDGQLEAFIIGSALKHSTVQIHVEKANKDIRGLYVAIGKFFLERNFEGFEYVNREEDMGLESLRQAKKMLHPVKMLKKYTIVLNDLHIEKANENDLYPIIDLWRESFEDEDKYSTNFYFMKCYNHEYTYLLKNNNTLVSMLQIVPYTLVFDNQEKSAFFILGVATSKDYQKQGLMKKLMNYVLSLPKYKNAMILLQAYNPSIYYNFGFKENYYHKITIIDKSKYNNNDLKTINNSDLKELVLLYEEFSKHFNGYRKRDLDYYQNYLLERCQSYSDEIKIFYDNDKAVGYVIFHQDDAKIFISEIIYINQVSFNKMIGTLLSTNKEVIVETDLKCETFGETSISCTMLTNFLDDENNNNLYINESL